MAVPPEIVAPGGAGRAKCRWHSRRELSGSQFDQGGSAILGLTMGAYCGRTSMDRCRVTRIRI
ncbi:hypothetical protein IG631_05518 [Alternaria alternata]|nr:hypothetical protein IG631_05518 [Alternaria alternata]